MIKNVLIKTTPATAIDCSNIERVTGIVIDSAEPENTLTKYLLSVDGGKWRKREDGIWKLMNETDLTAELVLQEGITKAELQALTENELSAFGGKIIDVAVAMQIGNNAELPSVTKIEMVGVNAQIKKDVFFSNVFKLSKESVKINGIEVAKTENSGGAVDVFASVQNDAGDWSEYVAYEKVKDKGKAIRFKAELEVDRPGISTAILNNVKIHHWKEDKTATMEGRSVLITKQLTLDNEVSRAHAIIKHPKISDTEFKMFIIFGNSNNFSEMTHTASYEKGNEIEENFEFTATDATSKIVTLKVENYQKSGSVGNEILGDGTGRQQAFKLAHNARPETLQVSGGNEWTYKEKTQTLLVTANVGNEISVSYDWIAKPACLTALACSFNS